MSKDQIPSGSLKIGWASRDITPTKPNIIRGQFHVRISKGALDPLTTTALAIETVDESGAALEQAMIISCDTITIHSWMQEKVRGILCEEISDFNPEKLFMNATHTHTGPEMESGRYPSQGPEVEIPEEHAAWFVTQVAEAAINAWKGRKTGGVSWAFGHAVVGHNRRAAFEDGTSRMYAKVDDPAFSHIEGYEDHGLNLLFTWDEKRSVTGMLINLACPSQVSEHEEKFSADFWHETRNALREKYGKGLFVLPQCSPAGDQSPHLLLQKKLEGAMRQRKGVSVREEIARRIVHGVDFVFEPARQDIQTCVQFRHQVEDIQLPVRAITEEDYRHAEAECKRLEKDKEIRADRKEILMGRHQAVMKRFEASDKNKPFEMELHVLRLGEVAMATSPFELFLDFGMRIKARSAAMQNFLVQLACGCKGGAMSGPAGQAGYLPSRRAVEGKGYGAEVASNPVSFEGGAVLVEETVKRINALWAKDAD